MGYGFVSFVTVEAAQRTKNECSKILFKGHKLYVNFFQVKSVRESHISEKIDRIQYQNYKKGLLKEEEGKE